MTAETLAKKNAVVALLVEEQGGRVVVEPADHNKFVMDVTEIVRACVAYHVGATFFQQLEELEDSLGTWVQENRQHLSAAYISYRATGELLFVAVQSGVKRDPELVRKLTDLDIEIANNPKFNELRLDVLSLPRSSRAALDAFLSSGRILEHAENQHAPASGD